MKRNLLRRERRLYVVGILTGSLFLLLLAGAIYLQDFALQASGNLRGKDLPASYTYMKTTYPWISQWIDSLQTHRALRDTFLTTDDGVRLHALYAQADTATPNTAVIVHGYTDNAVRMLHIGYLYHRDMGYNILLPDLRYSGLSEGTHLQMGWLDRLDVLLWMNVAHKRFSRPGADARLVVHGISMGGATTVCVGGEPQASYVRCFVEDCGFTSAWDEFEGELRQQFNLPAFPLLHAASLLTRWRYGWDFQEASALRQVARCTHPMLFIHGNSDTFVPTWMADSLYAAKPGSKELWKTDGTGHATSYLKHRDKYTEKVRTFVSRYMTDEEKDVSFRPKN